MIKRPLIVSTMALSAALLWGASTYEASAQEKSIEQLAPKSGWSVARMDQGGAANRYCALSRPYDQGLVLTLGRNMAEEYSVAIDFQAKKLNTEKSYPVTLQPGPGQIRAYEMLPASQRAMVIRLGFDESFLDAMKDSGYLKAEIDGKSYQFAVPNFSAGKSDLDNCLAGLKGKAPTPKTRVADSFKAEKVADAKPLPKKPEPEVIKAQPAPKIEMAKAQPKPEMAPQPAPAVEEPLPLKVETPKVEPPKVTAPKIEMAKVDPPKVEAPKTEVKIERVNSEQKPPTVFAANKNGPRVSTPIELKPATPPADVTPSKKIEMARVESKQMAPRPPEETPATPVKVETPKPAPSVSKRVEADSAPTIIRSNNDALLPKSLVSKQPEPQANVKQAVAQTDLQKKQREALEQLKADNERLNEALRNEINKPSSPNAAVRNDEAASLQRQIDQLQDELIKAKIGPNKIDDQLKSDVEKLKAENQQLKMAMQAQANAQAQQVQAKADMAMQEKVKQEQANQALADQEKAQKELAAKAKAEEEKARREELARKELAKQEQAQRELAEKISKEVDITPEPSSPDLNDMPEMAAKQVDPTVMRQLDNLKAENARLSSALQGQEKKLSSFDAQSPQASNDLSAIRKELELLRAENQKLASDARKARGQIDTAVYDTGNQALTKIREYEKKLQAARNDNVTLSKEIEEMRRLQEDGRLASVGGDWNLEKSTKRFNEAEREIKRLGLLLEQQRLAHRQEKAELEQMLFDPAVTDKEQRRRLRELELQLMAAESQLKTRGGSMPVRPVVPTMTPRSPIEERIPVAALTPEPMADQRRESLEMQRLNNKIERQNRQLQAYNQQQAANMATAPASPVQRQPVIGLGDNPAPRMDIQVHQQTRAPVTAQRLPPMAPVTQQPAYQQQQMAQQPMVMADSSAYGQGQIQQLLRNAGVSVSSGVKKQSSGQYRWSAGNLSGRAQVVPVKQAGSVDQFAQSYIANAKRSCNGDFASLPSTVGGNQSRAFEIACIGASGSTSSSVIFKQKGGDIVAISHEATAENMDTAMDARDRIAASL